MSKVYYVGSIPCSGNDIIHYGVPGMKWGKHLFGLVDKYVTGNTANRLRNSYQSKVHGDVYNIRNATSYGNQSMLRANQQSLQRNAALYNQYNNSYNNSLAGRLNTFGNNARNMYYNPAVRQRALSKAASLATNAYSNAAKQFGGMGSNISQFYNNAMGQAKDTIDKGSALVAQYGPVAVNNIKQLGQNALAGPKAFIENLLARRQARMNGTAEEEETEQRDYTPKLSGQKYNGYLNGEEGTSEDKKKKKAKSSKSSKSSKNSSSSKSKKETRAKEKRERELKKVYRQLQRMDLSSGGSPGLPSYLKNLQNLSK